MTTKVQKAKDTETLKWGDSPIELQDTQMLFKRDISLEEGEKQMHGLARMVKCAPWWAGDLLNYLEHQYGEKYTQAVDSTEWDYSTMKNFCWVCKGITPDRRRKELTFYMHLEVMRLEPKQQDELLEEAVVNGWSIREIRAAAQKLLPAHKQTVDKWMSFKDWFEEYSAGIDLDVAVIVECHAKAAWEAALDKGVPKAQE